MVVLSGCDLTLQEIFGHVQKHFWLSQMVVVCACVLQRKPLASNGQRAEKQLSILKAHGSLPQHRMIPPKMPILLLLRKPSLKDIVVFSISVTQEITCASCSSVCTLYQSNRGDNRAGDADRIYLHVWNPSNLHSVSKLNNESESTHHSLN